jgi:hypothetical protein
MKHRRRTKVGLAVLLAGLLLALPVATVFAELTPPGSVKQYSWDPSTGGGFPKWTNGENSGYWEGETAAMAAEITGEQGKTWDLPICLQVWEEPAPPTKAYGFTAFEPFDATTRPPNLPPPALPGDEAINYGFPAPWDTGDPLVYGYNIAINSVTAPVVGLPNCYANEIGVVVNYTPQANTGAYIVWGGHIAQAGDPLPAGSPDAIVPQGKSAGHIIGNFQARLRTASADKTLPFKVNAGPNAIEVRSLSGSVALGVPYGIAFAALAGLGAAGLLYRRRVQS